MIKRLWNRRDLLISFGKSLLVAAAAATPLKALAQTVGLRKSLDNAGAPPNYDPFGHSWLMVIDIEKCIGCGKCVEACKLENHVINEPFYFRTWIERYIVKRAEKRSSKKAGEILVDSPNGGLNGFPPQDIPKADVLKSFFVPKMCNHCETSPCTQVCPVGASFDAPDNVVLVDPNYCIGCGFCIQACPYGCRFLNPVTRTAEKCTLCYHRITKGLKPACAEVCPTQARIFGDLKDNDEDSPVKQFIRTKKTQVLKPHLRTHPRVAYAGMDEEVG